MQLYDAVSPLDYRYYGSDWELFERLKPYVTEKAYVGYLAKVEAALVKTMAKYGICNQAIAQDVENACSDIDPEAVYAEEQRIQHNIRALVNCIKRKVSQEANPYLHLFATSADIMDTASALRFKDLFHKVVIPDLLQLESLLIGLARQSKDMGQTGRTHGQYAVPITFGHTWAEYVSRLGNRIELIHQAAGNLRGQLSGAVGVSNSLALVAKQYKLSPLQFERDVLAELGLTPSTHSTQIVEPEYVTDLAYAVASAFGVLANLADDVRHLERSEISELREADDPDRVGSSTMPHKVNPKDYENVKSLWKAFMPRMTTLFLDQISEHQRDLTNSASGRFVMELFVGFISAVKRLNKSLAKIEVNQEKVRYHLDQTKETSIAEGIYTLLALSGLPTGYEYIHKLSSRCRMSGERLVDALQSDPTMQVFWRNLPEEQKDVLLNPEKYTGIAAEKTAACCDYWEGRLKNM
ncbi:MAG: adenylosuccinate lyase [Candidatus Schekmanbacteria bacterium]|nr:adenylosuccinate lyase [Candidatus Schekmanbacteria bacterium]